MSVSKGKERGKEAEEGEIEEMSEKALRIQDVCKKMASWEYRKGPGEVRRVPYYMNMKRILSSKCYTQTQKTPRAYSRVYFIVFCFYLLAPLVSFIKHALMLDSGNL